MTSKSMPSPLMARSTKQFTISHKDSNTIGVSSPVAVASPYIARSRRQFVSSKDSSELRSTTITAPESVHVSKKFDHISSESNVPKPSQLVCTPKKSMEDLTYDPIDDAFYFSYTPSGTPANSSKRILMSTDLEPIWRDLGDDAPYGGVSPTASSKSKVSSIVSSALSSKKPSIASRPTTIDDSRLNLFASALDAKNAHSDDPAFSTIKAQWDFMCSNFLKGDAQELEWLMISKQPGAYDYAHSKFSHAEDEYYKILAIMNAPGQQGMTPDAIQSALDLYCKEMEKWKKREGETAEYEEITNQQEKAWHIKEYRNNVAALETMRSYMPVDLTELTTEQLQSQIQDKNYGVFSFELIHELKRNKFLHWIIMHPEDIMNANFLVGESKPFFENLELYDIVEMRALCLCIPKTFKIDFHGKKAEWKKRFMTRLKLLVSQEKGELIKGHYDLEKQERVMVPLPPLAPDVRRRPVYYYRTLAQCDAKLAQYTEKELMLSKKSALLVTAIEDVAAAKKEYEVTLEDVRRPEFKAILTADQLSAAKDSAKKEWQTAESKRKRLQEEVNRLMTTISSNPIPKQMYIQNMNNTRSYLKSKGIEWDKITTPVLIFGVFDPNPVIEKRDQREVVKQLMSNLTTSIDEIFSESSKKNNNRLASSTGASTITNSNATSKKSFASSLSYKSSQTRRDAKQLDHSKLDAGLISTLNNICATEGENKNFVSKMKSTFLKSSPAEMLGIGQAKTSNHIVRGKPRLSSGGAGAKSPLAKPVLSTAEVIKQVRSKYLQVMLGPNQPAEAAPPAGAGGPMKRLGLPGGGLGAALGGGAGGGGMNFLSELKNKKLKPKD